MSYPTYPRDLPGLAYSQIRRPKHNVSVQAHQSGGEVRMSYWAEPLWEWDLTYEVLRSGFRNGRSYTELQQIEGLLHVTNGGNTGFQFHDDDDYQRFQTDLGATDGTTTAFDLVMYQGANPYIAGPYHIGFLDTTQPFNLYVDGSLVDISDPTYGYSLATGTPMKQQLVFNAAPPSGHALTADFQFLYYARFQADSLDLEKFMHQLWGLKKVTLTSLRY
ncbi:MAG TPA: DUF2460 domain-containing protein [Rhizomicrobium sp.]|jgi:uncharacterized protein (TIGR02217 family)|nr:DUF2460 domain-containing protein [Rhizomicrobium sp.]